ncbi:hypothetical protein I6Y99_004417 [Vibrio parahaemolyticus]|nr:hypothetical protein [Vibrio parahaemolyticus]
MRNLYSLVSDGISGMVNKACNDVTSTDLSKEAFFPLAYMGEMMHPTSMPLKEHEFAARCINLTGLACQIMNTHESSFTCTELHATCRKFINDICDELGMKKDDYQRIYWLNRIDKKLPA